MRGISPKPEFHTTEGDVEEAPQAEGQQRRSASQVEVGWGDHFLNRLGRFDDPIAQARSQTICAEIWQDNNQEDLEPSLNRYRPLVEGRKQDLLDALSSLAVEKRQTRATHAFRVVKQFGLPIRSKAEVDHFLAWMKAEGSPSCN